MEKEGVSDVEDGEIVDYNPLPRPITLVSKPCDSNLKYSDSENSEEENETDNSESDSDSSNFRSKKQKVPKKQRFSKTVISKKSDVKKYNIWCEGLNESVLTDELVNCGVRQNTLDRSRDVESYDYSLAYKLHDKEDEEESGVCQKYESVGRKRRFEERVNVKKRLGVRPPSDDTESKGDSRLLLDLKVTADDTIEEVARDIATKLCEQKEELILRVVEAVGIPKAMDIFTETKKIEENGGMLIMNGSRRRTPGGVYLLLVKKDDDIEQDKIQQIFTDDRRIAMRERKLSSGQLRKQKVKECKRSLSADVKLGERDLPTLMTRAELTVQQLAEGSKEKRGEADGEASVTNPPPSPATDGGDQPSDDRQVASYEDDFLDIACDNMDFF